MPLKPQSGLMRIIVFIVIKCPKQNNTDIKKKAFNSCSFDYSTDQNRGKRKSKTGLPTGQSGKLPGGLRPSGDNRNPKTTVLKLFCGNFSWTVSVFIMRAFTWVLLCYLISWPYLEDGNLILKTFIMSVWYCAYMVNINFLQLLSSDLNPICCCSWPAHDPHVTGKLEQFCKEEWGCPDVQSW